jgi:hypothetical protein
VTDSLATREQQAIRDELVLTVLRVYRGVGPTTVAARLGIRRTAAVWAFQRLIAGGQLIREGRGYALVEVASDA